MNSAIEINPIEIMQLTDAVNTIVVQRRRELGLETQNKRMYKGDIEVVLKELDNMGFSVVRTQKK